MGFTLQCLGVVLHVGEGALSFNQPDMNNAAKIRFLFSGYHSVLGTDYIYLVVGQPRVYICSRAAARSPALTQYLQYYFITCGDKGRSR